MDADDSAYEPIPFTKRSKTSRRVEVEHSDEDEEDKQPAPKTGTAQGSWHVTAKFSPEIRNGRSGDRWNRDVMSRMPFKVESVVLLLSVPPVGPKFLHDYAGHAQQATDATPSPPPSKAVPSQLQRARGRPRKSPLGPTQTAAVRVAATLGPQAITRKLPAKKPREPKT